jgi:hypothetical protein
MLGPYDGISPIGRADSIMYSFMSAHTIAYGPYDGISPIGRADSIRHSFSLAELIMSGIQYARPM